MQYEYVRNNRKIGQYLHEIFVRALSGAAARTGDFKVKRK